MAELDTSGGGGKKKHGGKKSKKMSTRVDLTPMVDLGFLLVTFFMLTTTFSKPQTMEINMPVKVDKEQSEKIEQDVKASEAMTLLLGPDNFCYYFVGLPSENAEVTKVDYSKDGLRRAVLVKQLQLDAVKRKEFLTVVIKASDESNYRNLVDALDEMNILNVKRYAIVDINEMDKKLLKKAIGG
ncbi:MAG: biopolymer transporter ExbD [Ignavibacteria bacterium]|nr:biopolymer transporter ExbD [Ignavibacteria bacterium]